jgi:hypothetical protein
MARNLLYTFAISTVAVPAVLVGGSILMVVFGSANAWFLVAAFGLAFGAFVLFGLLTLLTVPFVIWSRRRAERRAAEAASWPPPGGV